MVETLVSHQPLVISVSEELGRTVSELTRELYMAEYRLEVRTWSTSVGRVIDQGIRAPAG